MLALAGLTFFVLILVGRTRFKAGFARRVKASDFRYGESANVPPDVSIPNRNLMNLLEVPMLFYVVCVAFYATRTVDSLAVWLAWGYVALRALHSVVHLTYNNVYHRLSVFAASNVILVVLWARWALAISRQG
jgi:hypothetical protein